MPPLVVFAIVFGLLAGYVVLVLRRGKPAFLARAEYWVYLPGTTMPKQDDIMTWLVQQNPHGAGVIGKNEGLVMSDIRFHMGIALRSKNPHVFRPDLFKERAEPSPAILQGLADSRALVKVRFVSEVPLRDKRHLQLLPHAAEAVASLGGGTVIYDFSNEKLWSLEDFSARLDESKDATRFEFQVDIAWTHDDRGRTFGLGKIGLPELVTPVSPADQRVIVLEIIEEVARQLWAAGTYSDRFEVERYGDRFVVDMTRNLRDTCEARITRFNSALN